MYSLCFFAHFHDVYSQSLPNVILRPLYLAQTGEYTWSQNVAHSSAWEDSINVAALCDLEGELGIMNYSSAVIDATYPEQEWTKPKNAFRMEDVFGYDSNVAFEIVCKVFYTCFQLHTIGQMFFFYLGRAYRNGNIWWSNTFLKSVNRMNYFLFVFVLGL